MELEKVIETAMATVLDSIVGLNVRAYLVDDAVGTDVPEPLSYPYCALAASPVEAYRDGDILQEVVVRVVIATHILKDPKRANLSSYLSQVRVALTRNAIDNALPNTAACYYVNFDSEEPEADEEEQREILVVNLAIASTHYTTTTTTTT